MEALVNLMLEAWKERGACSDLPVDVFFPVPGRHMNVNILVAKAHCAACPVKRECLDYALRFDHRTLPGIWGGTTENERLKIRRSRVVNLRK